ncbi:HTH_48 domain-containing protein [Trichonephila inaurata madagascariensis]|uniref:HTH_48 domain-containing protein n=1 Tax=Trichonephila inaurata madagascariensis TaxID=2747483 RepID=A0A8X6WQW9_9ARAC|nr:HTH_48 domain-containing protein [Trichonephila inaurata madagascariensis]
MQIRNEKISKNAVEEIKTAERWVKAFNEGRQNVADMHLSGHPRVSETNVPAVATLMDSDGRQTIRELARQTGFSHTTLLHILKKRLNMRKIASRWGLHLMEMQK